MKTASRTQVHPVAALSALLIIVCLAGCGSSTAPGDSGQRSPTTPKPDATADMVSSPGSSATPGKAWQEYATVTGMLTDSSGTPVAECSIGRKLSSAASDLADPEFAMQTGEDGRYSATLPPGEWTFTFACDSSQTQRDATLVAGETTMLDVALK